MKKVVATIVFSAVSMCMALAQTRTTEYNNIGWLTTTITPAISKKVSGHIEYQYRRAEWGERWQQSLLRLGLNYKIHPQVTAHVGYGWILTFPYGENTIAAVPKTFPEHRIYEQLVINGSAGKVSLQHRLRLEQRWLGKFSTIASEEPDDFIYLNRVRYMLRADVPLYKKLYAAAYDEIFIGFGRNVGENVFDQNRIGLLVGYKQSAAFRIEAGFLNQAVQLGREVNNRNVYQQNSGVIINTYIQFDCSKTPLRNAGSSIRKLGSKMF